MKKLVLIIFLLILLLPAGEMEAVIFNNRDNISIFTEKNSYVWENSENINWYVVKIHSNQTINIGEIYAKIEANETNGTQWLLASRLIIIDFENERFLTPGEIWIIHGKFFEWYLQMNIGKLNFTWNHLCKKVNGNFVSAYSLYNISLPAGTWYLILIKVPTNKCKITTYINDTNAEIRGISYGSNIFLLENENFWAKFNLKTSLLSIIMDGRKTISVNNTFVGFFYCSLGFGKACIEYKSPTGETGKCKVLSTFRKIIISDDSTFFPVFIPIIGGKGSWTFNTSMIGIGLGNAVDILGADITLP